MDVSEVSASRRETPLGLSGAALLTARLGWLAATSTAVGSFFLSLTARQEQLMRVSVFSREVLAEYGLRYDFLRNYVASFDGIIFGAFVLLALFIFLSRPDNGFAMYVSSMIVFVGVALVRPMDSLAGVARESRILLLLSVGLGELLVILFMYIFPDGRLRPRWMLVPAILWTMWSVIWHLVIPLSQRPMVWPPRPQAPLFVLLWVVSGLAAQILRYRDLSSPADRQKARWVVWGMLLAGSGFLAFVGFPLLVPAAMAPSPARLVYILAGVPILYLTVSALPVSVAVAVLRHRLWDVDTLLSQTILYISMTGIVTGLYSGSIAVFQRLFISFTGDRSSYVPVLTTVLVVAVFTPIHKAMQNVVERRLRHRANPYEELKEYDRHIQSVLDVMDPAKLSTSLLNKAAASIGASSGAIYYGDEEDARLLYTCGDWQGEATITFPIEAKGVKLGWIAVGPPIGATAYTQEQEAMIRQCAARIGQALAVFGPPSPGAGFDLFE